MKLVFLGPPGAGKGTQAKRMADELGSRHASTGDIFRAAVAEGSELGRTVQSYLDGGKLVPDALTSRVVEEMVVERVADFILDGFPRTVPQAEMLDQMLAARGQKLDAVVYYHLDEETAVERLTGRLVCKACGRNYHRKFMPPRQEMTCDECAGQLMVRSDSCEEVVRRRLVEYNEKTSPLVPYYRDKGLLHQVDASLSPEQVEEETRSLLRSL